jgi:hypothetical protein
MVDITVTYNYDSLSQTAAVTGEDIVEPAELSASDATVYTIRLVGDVVVDVDAGNAVTITNSHNSVALFTHLRVRIEGLSGVTGVISPTDNLITAAYPATLSASTGSTVVDLAWRPKGERLTHLGLKGSGTYSFTYA